MAFFNMGNFAVGNNTGTQTTNWNFTDSGAVTFGHGNESTTLLGKRITVKSNGAVIVDGVQQTEIPESQRYTITIHGDIDHLAFDGVGNVTVNGNVRKVKTENGDVDVDGNAERVSTTSGNITAKKVTGIAKTENGNMKVGEYKSESLCPPHTSNKSKTKKK